MIKKHISTVTMMAILAGIYQFGCANAAEAPDTTMQMTKFEGIQGDCTNGGVKFEVLVDNIVDESQTQYICNGIQGAAGQTGQSGTHTTMRTSQFEGTQGTCTNGGVKIEVLVDGVVDDTQTQYICNGAQGADGQTGQSGTNTTFQATQFEGAQGDCTNGGVKIEVLVNGTVDDTQTQYICNGSNGQNGENGETGQSGTSTSIKTTQFDGAQGDCTNGGVKIEVLINGTVDDTQTQYICNGTQGQGGQNGTNTTMKTTKFDGAQGDCTNGGVKIEVLVNGTVDDTQTQYICNGSNGQNGENGENGQSGSSSTIQTTKFDGAQGDCTNGGVKIEVLLNGVVDGTQTQYICNGTQGQDGQSGTSTSIKTTKFDGAQGDCTNGGVKIEVLVNGVVDSTQTQYICNSAAQGGIFCSGLYKDVMNDSANCGSCGNVCQAGYECINGTCKPFSDFSQSTTILCNSLTTTPYTDRENCNGCGIHCPGTVSCQAGQCVPKIGEIFTFGKYEQDNDTTNGKEPIEWRVLDQNTEGQYLVISEKVLEQKKYNETDRSITWEKSTIRSWLNGYAASYNSNGENYTAYGFIDAAFTAEEQAKIVASNVPAHANPSYGTSPGNSTTDKIFLLSITEAKTYFANDTDRLADATRYAVKQGVYVRGTDTVSTTGGTTSSNGTCTSVHCYAYWWLRSPGHGSNDAAGVSSDGAVGTRGGSVNSGYTGVRPALWLDY